jgi:hypothetical protein
MFRLSAGRKRKSVPFGKSERRLGVSEGVGETIGHFRCLTDYPVRPSVRMEREVRPTGIDASF